MTEQDFVAKLSTYRGKNVFNPWGESDALHDIGAAAPIIRRMNLAVYMGLRPQVDYIFMGEALGYQGGHFSGVALTCERMLLGYHDVKPEVIFGEYQAKRTSDPTKLSNKVWQMKGFNEPTDTVVWQGLQEFGFDTNRVFLWNIFPFHPYQEGDLLTNRTPTQEELREGFVYFKELQKFYPRAKVVAIGKKCQQTLAAFGVECVALRHPSMGGAAEFRRGLTELSK